VLWAITILLGIAYALLFPSDDGHFVSSTFYFSGSSILSGLLIAWVLRLGRSTFYLLSALISLKLFTILATIALKLGLPGSADLYANVILSGIVLLAPAFIIYFGYGTLRNRRRRAAAIFVSIGVNLAAGALFYTDDAIWDVSAKIRPLMGLRDAPKAVDSQPPDMDDDILWGAQSALIERARAALGPAVSGRPNVYAMAVAGSGTQALFSREAHEALRVAAVHFGDESRGAVLLSNGAADLMQSPLATRANIAAIAQAIGEKAHHKQDLLFLYMASHGGRTAELASTLPNYRSVQPISSTTTAEALKKAGVVRRVIIVSACFSATWIPALADDNTIVITAAAKDRTSFGCDDSRRLTVFGEAFLGSLAARNVSLHDAFEDARRKISVEERKEGVTPSMPQAYVGRNMGALWLGQPDSHSGT